MPITPGDLLQRFFDELEREALPYVMLHSYERLPEIASDVDYAVLTRDLPRLAGIQRRLAEAQGWRLAHAIVPHVHALYTVLMDPQDPRSFLQLDACGHYVESGARLIEDVALLQNRRRHGKVFIPRPEIEFRYLLTKALGKPKPIAPLLPRLEQLWKSAPAEVEGQFLALLGDDVPPVKEWFSKPPELWEQLREKMLERHRFGWGDKLAEVGRLARRVIRPKGLVLGFAGPESAVCAEVIERVGDLIQGALFRRKLVLRLPSGRAPGVSARLTQILPAKVRNELVIMEDRSGAKSMNSADLVFVLEPGAKSALRLAAAARSRAEAAVW